MNPLKVAYRSDETRKALVNKLSAELVEKWEKRDREQAIREMNDETKTQTIKTQLENGSAAY